MFLQDLDYKNYIFFIRKNLFVNHKRKWATNGTKYFL